MYSVPMEIPKFCNKCPFGQCDYSLPFGRNSVSHVDGKENKTGTCGYVCNVEFQNKGRYTKVIRANIEEDIPKPDWCGLMEMENQNE